MRREKNARRIVQIGDNVVLIFGNRLQFDRPAQILQIIAQKKSDRLLFVCGLWLHGRLFPFEVAQPLVALAAFANLGMGIPYFIARATGAGAGDVIAITYEYGNSYLIVAGLLNMLVVLDAFDVAQGRK